MRRVGGGSSTLTSGLRSKSQSNMVKVKHDQSQSQTWSNPRKTSVKIWPNTGHSMGSGR